MLIVALSQIPIHLCNLREARLMQDGKVENYRLIFLMLQLIVFYDAYGGINQWLADAA